VIIDSRYPYEYEGGHIAHALNIYTKERLYDEMFIKRSHKNTANFNNSTMDMDSSGESMYPPEAKRTIIIFHCEFSSERGPSL
jgi:M-phase inducer phosphatase 2